MFVALGIQHEVRMHNDNLCHPALPYFPTLCHTEHDFLRKFQRDMIRNVCWSSCYVPLLEDENQMDATYYFIVLLIDSTCFGHYYVHHQELATIMLITTLVVLFLVYCRLEFSCG